MDLTHLHLLTNHIPILGAAFGALVLIYGIIVKSKQTKVAALLIFLVSAIGGIITFSTGEAAEETLESIAGISHSTIEAHEDFAKISMILINTLGVLSLAGLFIAARFNDFFTKYMVLVLLISIITLGAVARTGFLGGKIRHSELGSATSIGNNVQETDHEYDDD